jgi:hypothetical protein
VFASDKLVFGARAIDMYGEMLLAIRRIVRIETGARCAVRTLGLFSNKQRLALTVPAPVWCMQLPRRQRAATTDYVCSPLK